MNRARLEVRTHKVAVPSMQLQTQAPLNINLIALRIPVDFNAATHVRTSAHSVVRSWKWPAELPSGHVIKSYILKVFLSRDLFTAEKLVAAALLRASKPQFFVLPVSLCEYVVDGVVCSGIIYPFVDHLPRKTLTLRLQQSMTQFWKLAAALLEGVEALHELGYTHCDIKPDNILVTDIGNQSYGVRLIDFSCTHRTGTVGSVAGTFGYRAPEVVFRRVCRLQWRQGVVSNSMFYWSAAQDVFSTGMTLLALLLGEHPITGDSDGEYNALGRLCSNPHEILIQTSDAYVRLHNKSASDALEALEFLRGLIHAKNTMRTTVRAAIRRCMSALSET